jgi:hypothetical protein
MSEDLLPRMRSPDPGAGESIRARWQSLSRDYGKLAPIDDGVVCLTCGGAPLRDVGDLLLLGHDRALADAELYVVSGHTARTGEFFDVDDIDDIEAIERWSRALDGASASGVAPPVPRGFWASYLHWRTPLGMARNAERRSTARIRLRS